MTDYETLLSALAGAGVQFIIVGGAAATAHGASRLTEDLDVVYSRSPDNVHKIVTALAPLKPYPRGAPAGLPFHWDEQTLQSGMNFTLTTSAGAIDLLGEIAGGNFQSLNGESESMKVFGVECRLLNLRRLIEAKRAAGRPKDFEAIAELEDLLEESGG